MRYLRIFAGPFRVVEEPPDPEAPMSVPYSLDTILLDSADPGEVDRLNDALQSHDLGRPLGQASRTAAGHLVVPVIDADPVLLLHTLKDDRLRIDPVYHNGTFFLDGKDNGHAFAWASLTVDAAQEPPRWEPLPPHLRRPVVAQLDTGVRPHPWLPEHREDDPFLLVSDLLPDPWRSPVVDGAGVKPGDVPEEGHATFLAGLIRVAAPSARILSMRVMGDDGTVNESTLISALQWLAGHRTSGNPVDVLCMAFGRRPGDDGDQMLYEIERRLRSLADAGVRLVASAGNNHQQEPIYPAAFDMVTAVGAGFGGYHAEFSNFGEWVDRYRDGVDVLSIMPPDRWARWSGTSFAAANFAGDLARPYVL
jgi:subtilisin family serine protease